MVGLSSIPSLAVVLSSCFRRGAAQYDRCEGPVADIGNGECDAELNVPSCGYDGGDCCSCTCVDGPTHSCSDSDFDCIYPGCDIVWWEGLSDVFSDDDVIGACYEYSKGDGQCDILNNHYGCDYDGGDVSH